MLSCLQCFEFVFVCLFFLATAWFKTCLCFFCGQANAIGRSAKTVREFLEKNYTGEAIATDNEDIKLAVKALLEASEPFIVRYLWVVLFEESMNTCLYLSYKSCSLVGKILNLLSSEGISPLRYICDLVPTVELKKPSSVSIPLFVHYTSKTTMHLLR